MIQAWRERVRAALPSARFDEPLARYTTFRIGGPADCYAEVSTRDELVALLRVVRDEKIPFMMLGFGSNMLVRDGGVRGVVARLRGGFERVEFGEGGRVYAFAAVRVPQLVVQCAERGLAGAEPLVGIPGTVGGALVMNAGTREGEIGALVKSVDVLDREALAPRALEASALRFEYRRSALENQLVLGGALQLLAGDKRDIMRRVQQFQKRRLQTQPIHTFNVGSTFKNPPGRFVAQLIEQAGLKGRSRGGARVSPLHANFIENFDGATAADVLALVDEIKAVVARAAGVELELEMKVVGEA